MLPNEPYHGRTAMTNQDAALMAMREMQARVSSVPAAPPANLR